MSEYQLTGYRIPETRDEQQALIAKVKEHYAEKRARGEIERPPTPEETLAALEEHAHAGRTLKFDLRVAPEEKLRWAEAAAAMGLSVSEFVRAAVEQACSEVLAPEPVSV